MGKKKEDMTEEEREAACARMAELRQIASAKISERAKEKRDTEDIVRKAKRDKAAYDREQAEKTLKDLEFAKQRDAQLASKPKPEPEPEPLHVDELPTPMPPPPKATKKKLVVPDSDSGDDDASYKAFLKEKLKSKYETKYRMKYAPAQTAPPPPPAPMIQNPIQETARDVLKSKVNEEVRKMAMASLFGGGGWA